MEGEHMRGEQEALLIICPTCGRTYRRMALPVNVRHLSEVLRTELIPTCGVCRVPLCLSPAFPASNGGETSEEEA